jgi:hypothetical protein
MSPFERLGTRAARNILLQLDDSAREALADFLIEELATASASEILEETRALYGDENYLANEVQMIFERAWKAVRPNDPLPVARSARLPNPRR